MRRRRNDPFTRNLGYSVAAHAALIVVLLVVSLARGCAWRTKPKEIALFMDLAELPPQPVVAEPQPKPPEPKPEPPQPEDIREPVKPKPKPPPPKTNQVAKTETPKPKPPAPSKPPPPKLTQAQIAKLLAQGMPLSAPGAASGAAGDPSQFGWYYAMVKQAMYEAWSQPGGLSVAPGQTTVVEIRVERSGAVTRRRLVKSSGNRALDDSVMQAVESVRSLKPLPQGLGGMYKDITIEFELTR